MFDFIKRYQLLAEGLVIAVAVVAFAIWWHGHNVEQQNIGYDRRVAEDNAKLIAALNRVRELEKENAEQRSNAIAAAAQRDQAIRNAAAAAATASSGLRDAIANIAGSRLPAADLATARLTAATLGQLFGDCADRYRGLAEKADRHASDTRTLIEAWPKR